MVMRVRPSVVAAALQRPGDEKRTSSALGRAVAEAGRTVDRLYVSLPTVGKEGDVPRRVSLCGPTWIRLAHLTGMFMATPGRWIRHVLSIILQSPAVRVPYELPHAVSVICILSSLHTVYVEVVDRTEGPGRAQDKARQNRFDEDGIAYDASGLLAWISGNTPQSGASITRSRLPK